MRREVPQYLKKVQRSLRRKIRHLQNKKSFGKKRINGLNIDMERKIEAEMMLNLVKKKIEGIKNDNNKRICPGL